MKTKGGSNIVSAIHNLAIVKLHFTSFINEHKASSGARMFSTCNSRIDWIYEQMQCHPFLDQSVRDAIKSEWQSDVFLPDEIEAKIRLLSPTQREALETVLDDILEGKETTIHVVDANNVIKIK